MKDPAARSARSPASPARRRQRGGRGVAAGIPALPAGEKLGLELDPTKLDADRPAGPRRTYRVQAFGEIERKQKNAGRLAGVPADPHHDHGGLGHQVVPQNVRKPPVPKGAWVFMRED